MADPTSIGIPAFGGMGNIENVVPAIMKYVEGLSNITELEVIGIITILLALGQISLCLTLAMDNYQMNKRLTG